MDTQLYRKIDMRYIIDKYKILNISNLSGGKQSGYKWTTFKHNGVMFSPEYIKHDIPVIYDGKEVILNKFAEEYATEYVKYIGTEYLENKAFNKNFWSDWKKLLGDTIIKNLDSCDFSKIRNYVLKKREDRKNLSKEEKEQLKKSKDLLEEKYKIAYVDGQPQPVGNFKMEPPGIFIGRGNHPKIGSLKKRILPEDITLNIGKNEPIPELPSGHKWYKIIHDRTLEWLASWVDNVTGKRKYIWLGSHSKFKSQSDIKKFDLARKLKKHIKNIRNTMKNDLISESKKKRELATVLYLIDNFALRVGNEKNTDEHADTVGATNLKKEHVELKDNNTIVLDFLGKDSIRYYDSHQVESIVYKNISEFTVNKKKGDDVFSEINSSDVNDYLQQFMKDLTAKVFRTYNASYLFQNELNKISSKYDNTINIEISDSTNSSSDTSTNNNYKNDTFAKETIKSILEAFNKANIKVALLCNHQKGVSKSFDIQMDKIKDKILEYKKMIKKLKNDKNNNKKIKKLKEKIKELKKKKESKCELKNVSLDTSKANYIDPRIIVAFTKKHKLPIEKIYSKTLINKFGWAINDENITENWKF
jgi:DNA topoisomerase I